MSSHRKTTRGMLLGATALAGALTLAVGPAAAQEARQYEFNLPAQPLSSALQVYGATADQQLMFADADVQGRTAPALKGSYTADDALRQLLAGTGLHVRRTDFGVLQISRASAPQGGSAANDGADIEALIVTAQKKEEAIQDVPIAISAFTQKSLDAQKIEGGFDLLKAIPNVTFSKSNFSGYNFSIRGVGTKAISATTDPGVAVSFNNTTLIVNRLFEQEYFDVERVEVLRGPQGTLYGRNATSGVINVLSARPKFGEFEGEVKVELGNYNAQRVKGMINVPVGDTLALRVAGAITKRDGYGVNEAAGTEDDTNGVSADVDGRDLWSLRATLGWEPIEQIRVNALWERFEEDDNRVRTSKQLCHHDAGPQTVGSFDWANRSPAPTQRASTSQGCLPGSLYADEAFGTPNGASLPYVSGLAYAPTFGMVLSGQMGLGGNPYWAPPGGTSFLPAPCSQAGFNMGLHPVNVCQPDPYGGLMQSRDLRTIYSLLEPRYRAKADIFELSIDIDLTDSLTFTSQTVYAEDEYYASQDYNRFTTLPIFTDSGLGCNFGPVDIFPPFGIFQDRPICDGTPYKPTAEKPDGYYNILPGGVFTDPQLGASRTLVGYDLSEVESEQFNQEFRLVSNFDAPFNFSLGANFTRFETWNDYYVFLNAATLLTQFFPWNTDVANIVSPGCSLPDGECALYVDPNPIESINGEGHNYFRSANPYTLTSSAIFGELYWQTTETLKVTAGARMTWDEKVFTPIPSQLLLFDYRIWAPEGEGPYTCTQYATIERCKLGGTGVGGRGSPAEPDIVQEWREPTGRIIVDWKPDLGFTDETMVYGSYAHGYKGGGANPPSIAPPAGLINSLNSGGVNAATFEPEYIDAFEVGAKNTLLGGALILNGSAFYYDYEGYQVSKIVDRSAYNENFDSKIWGLELEWIFSPTRNLRFNGTIGNLHTEIAEGERSIDLMDRTQENTTGMEQTFVGADGIARTGWAVVKPWITNSSNCVVPKYIMDIVLTTGGGRLVDICPGGGILGANINGRPSSENAAMGLGPSLPLPGGIIYDPITMAPNGGAGFWAELGGKELPNAPHWTSSLGAQYRMALPGGWDATLRGDFYWQSQSYARVYNTQYDKLRAWTNANLSLWVENPDWGVTAEVYVKNAFDETPITDSFLNSDDSGLTTNVFTLDPRLVGVSVRKRF